MGGFGIWDMGGKFWLLPLGKPPELFGVFPDFGSGDVGVWLWVTLPPLAD
jgi:hypothetical protein